MNMRQYDPAVTRIADSFFAGFKYAGETVIPKPNIEVPVGPLRIPLADLEKPPIVNDWCELLYDIGKAAYFKCCDDGTDATVSDNLATPACAVSGIVLLMVDFKAKVRPEMATKSGGPGEEESAKYGPKYDADIPSEHKTQDTGPRFSGDVFLRQHGFAIHSRPRKGPTLWTRNGRVVTEAVATDIANRDPKPKEPEPAKKGKS